MEDALRRLTLFTDLSDAELSRVAARGEAVWLEPGEAVFTPRRPAEHLIAVLEGAVRIVAEHEGRETLHATLRADDTFAEASSLVGVPFPGSVHAVERTRLFRLPAAAYRELVREHPAIVGRLLQAVEARALGHQETLQRREKLAALGQHAAGLAHELNNPATAGRRAVEQLSEALSARDALALKVQHRGLTPAQWEALLRASQQGAGRGRTQGLDPLARGDAEDALAGWLDEQGVENAWELAPTLLDAGLGEDALRPLAAQLPAESLAGALAWLEASVRTRTLLAEVCQSTKRMSELARAVKSYARTEEHPQADVDVHEGLESTLLMLTYKLKHGVEVVRHFDLGLPHLTANASELIQVWTNLVDNAIDAMKGKGTLEVRTARDGDGLLVEIIDDGPGIPADVMPEIFEPFFTTKPAGQGTGLGLDISHRIVVDNHHGTLRVESRPGRTAFQVRLPLGPPAPR